MGKFKILVSKFLGTDKNGNSSYEIMFNLSLGTTDRLTGIEEGLNNYSKDEIGTEGLVVRRSDLIIEIGKWSEKYEITCQLCGKGNNNIHISKGHVTLLETGGFETPESCMIEALRYIYKINKTPKSDRVVR